MGEIKRHFSVTVYVFDVTTDKFVFIRHKKLQKWLPPGGHIEPNETPDNAVVRETIEETGISNIEFVTPSVNTKEIDGLLNTPFAIQLNHIKENHEHLDLIYLVTTKNPGLILNREETDGIQEYDLSTIMKPDFDSFENTKKWCEYFYNFIKKKNIC
jgi:8-oxo-dGTP pyrophosphatase MutT (NUDIX family)